MEVEKLIIAFLEGAGFEKKGNNQYFKKEVGTIFIRQWDIQVVMIQIMELGAQHNAKQIRDALGIKEEISSIRTFNPQV